MLPTADEFGAAMERPRHRPRRPHRRLRQFARAHRGARLVHAPPFRRATRSRSSTAASEMASPKGARPKAASRRRATRVRGRRGAPTDRHQAADPRRRSAARLLDARGKGRFEGSEPEPRPGSRRRATFPARATCRSASSIARTARSSRRTSCARLFAEAGIDPTQPFVASCGSGVTANGLIFAAHLSAATRARLYDGSWSEWGADPATPKAVGPA